MAEEGDYVPSGCEEEFDFPSGDEGPCKFEGFGENLPSGNEMGEDLPSGNEMGEDLPSGNDMGDDFPSGNEMDDDFPSGNEMGEDLPSGNETGNEFVPPDDEDNEEGDLFFFGGEIDSEREDEVEEGEDEGNGVAEGVNGFEAIIDGNSSDDGNGRNVEPDLTVPLEKWFDMKEWSEEPQGGFPYDLPETEKPGIRKNVWDGRRVRVGRGCQFNVTEFFALFWPLTWYNLLAEKTNKYAHQKVANGKLKNWNDTDPDEMMAFHAMWIYMSENKCEAGLKGYWGDKGRSWEHQFIVETMSGERFQQLRQNLHVCEISDYREKMDPRDPTWKSKVWYDMENEQVLLVWSPTKFVVLDECCIRLCGRSFMKETTGAKPIKHHALDYLVVDAAGVILFRWLYPGQKHCNVHQGIATSIVEQAMKYVPGPGHIWGMDCFYGSPEAAKLLHEKGDHSIQMLRKPPTVKANSPAAKSPLQYLKKIVPEKSPRGTYKRIFFQDKLSLILWNDNKLVAMLSDHFRGDNDGKVYVMRWFNDVKRRLPLICTEEIPVYNCIVHYVDRVNLKKAQADVISRFVRQWFRTFTNGPICDAECSSWSAMKFMTKSKWTFSAFRKPLAMDLRYPYMLRKPAKYVGLIHISKRGTKRSDCFHCLSLGRRSKAIYYCTGCNVCLHADCCFDFHKKIGLL